MKPLKIMSGTVMYSDLDRAMENMSIIMQLHNASKGLWNHLEENDFPLDYNFYDGDVGESFFDTYFSYSKFGLITCI